MSDSRSAAQEWFSDYQAGLPTRGGSEANGLQVEWQQFRLCVNCNAKCADILAPRCPSCGAPWSRFELDAWRERQALPWWRRWLRA